MNTTTNKTAAIKEVLADLETRQLVNYAEIDFVNERVKISCRTREEAIILSKILASNTDLFEDSSIQDQYIGSFFAYADIR